MKTLNSYQKDLNYHELIKKGIKNEIIFLEKLNKENDAKPLKLKRNTEPYGIDFVGSLCNIEFECLSRDDISDLITQKLYIPAEKVRNYMNNEKLNIYIKSNLNQTQFIITVFNWRYIIGYNKLNFVTETKEVQIQDKRMMRDYIIPELAFYCPNIHSLISSIWKIIFNEKKRKIK